MIRIIDDRATGKTTRLIVLAKEHHGLLAVGDGKQDAIKDKAERLGATGVDIISYSELISGRYEIGRPVFIDEVELFLKRVCPQLEGYSLSNEGIYNSQFLGERQDSTR